MDINIIDYKKILKNGIKLYIKGKEFKDKDKIKSIKLLRESLICLNKIKNINKFNKYKDLIHQTESECSRSLNNYISDYKNKKNNIFKMISKGQINKINKFNYNEINFNQYNHEGLTPLHYSIKMGDMKILKKFLKIGGRLNTIDKNGHTLLEYACLEKDPSFINFLVLHGANMKKHLEFRKNNNLLLQNDDIDMALILKKIILLKNKDINNKLIFIFEYVDKNKKIGLNNYTTIDLLMGLTEIFKKKEEHYIDNYINILKEELKYNLKNKLCCPKNKIDIILINLIPFINYEYNISTDYILSNEIKFLIIKILKDKNNINYKTCNELINILWKKYITNNLFTNDYIGIITYQLISKINI